MDKIWMKDGVFTDITSEQKGALSVEDLAKYTTDKQAASIKEVKEDLAKQIADAQKGSITAEQFEAFKTSVQKKLDGVDIKASTKDEIMASYAELKGIAVQQGAVIKSLKETNNQMSENQKKDFAKLSKRQQMKFLLEKGLESDSFKDWIASDMRGHVGKMTAKSTVGLASDHTGAIFVTEPSDNVTDIERMQPHMRDILAVSSTEETDITYPEVTDFTDIYTMGTQMLNENEAITDVTFKSKENTSKVARLGVSMSISKRYLRGRSSIIANHVLAQIPDAMLLKEDIQTLNGDGSGNNLSGFVKDARKLGLDGQAFTAGQVASVASYNDGDQALITFTVEHGMLSGDEITFASATESSYNATHKDCLLIDAKSIVINVAYVAEAVVSAWTGQSRSYRYKDVDGAQEIDVLVAAKGILDAGLYNGNVVIINPNTRAKITSLKGTDQVYLSNQALEERLNVKVVVMPIIPAGWYLMGDFSPKAVEIKEYSTMTVQILEDITTKRSNSFVVMADEEIHLVKYNPKWYIYDRFSNGIAQLETV